MPASDVLLDVGAQAGVSILPPPKASTQLITASFLDAPAETVIRHIASSFGLTPLFNQGVVTFGDGASSGTFLLLDPGYESPHDLVEIIRAVSGDNAVAKVVGQRVALVVPAAQVERISQLETQLRTGADSWELTVLVFDASNGFLRDLGLSATASASGTLGIRSDNDGLGNLEPIQARLNAAVNALYTATESSRRASLVTHGTLLIMEGESATLSQGEVIPVPMRTVTDQGTVTVTGFESVRSGFILNAKARRVPTGVRLDINPTLSSVTGYIEGRPVLAERSMSATVVLDTGDWVIMSGLDLVSHSTDRQGMPGVSFLQSTSRRSDRSTLVLAIRAVRVYAANPPST